MGGTTALGNVTLTAVNSISLPAITTAAGKTIGVSLTSSLKTITTTGVLSVGSAGNISLSADDMVLGANLSGTGTLTLTPTGNGIGMLVGGGLYRNERGIYYLEYIRDWLFCRRLEQHPAREGFGGNPVHQYWVLDME